MQRNHLGYHRRLHNTSLDKRTSVVLDAGQIKSIPNMLELTKYIEVIALLLTENLSKKRISNSRAPISSDIDVIKDLKSKGCPQSHIAQELNLSTAAVSLILNNQYRVNEDHTVNVDPAYFTA